VDISRTCKVAQKNGVSLPLLTCSPSASPFRLLYRRGRKSRRDLWITLYIASDYEQYNTGIKNSCHEHVPNVAASLLTISNHFSQPYKLAWVLLYTLTNICPVTACSFTPRQNITLILKLSITWNFHIVIIHLMSQQMHIYYKIHVLLSTISYMFRPSMRHLQGELYYFNCKNSCKPMYNII
jgi:hypothetical protein